MDAIMRHSLVMGVAIDLFAFAPVDLSFEERAAIVELDLIDE